MTRSRGERVTLAEVEQALKNGAQLIDVRAQAEYRTGHAVGARNVPLQDIQSAKSLPVNLDVPIYVYCHSGARAGAAKSLLRKAGYTKVINIGGLHAWKSMGGKVVK